jgi:hypothetical protein
MSTAAVALTNEALRLLGEISITSFDEGSDLAESANLLFDSVTRGLLARHPWRFTLAKARLARVDETPTSEWKFLFALPPDRLLIREVTTSELPGAGPLLAYELFGDRLMADHEALWCDYQRARDPSLWPPHFVDLARVALAAAFAVPVTGSTSLAQLYDRQAFGTPEQSRQGGQMAEARRLDSQQQPPARIGDFPLTQARHGGAGIGRRAR